jgi:GT2 family glycosyltransferase
MERETLEKETPTVPSTEKHGRKDGSEPSATRKLKEMPASTFAAQAPTPAANPLANLLAPAPLLRRPEFSVITCSVRDERFKQMEQCYQNSLQGEDYEIIRITDATGIAEGYIRGAAQASGDILIFSHDDAAAIRPFAARLRQHLRSVDIVAGAGTDRLDGPAWFTAGPPHLFGQVLNNVPAQPGSPPFLLSVYGVPKVLTKGIMAFDGFWFAMKRDVLDAVAFDPEMCDGFHMYDVDFSLRAYLGGLKIGVASDLSLMHASTGGYGDPKWKPGADKWYAKYSKHLYPHRNLGFQMTAITGHLPSEMLNVMDQFVARASEA